MSNIMNSDIFINFYDDIINNNNVAVIIDGPEAELIFNDVNKPTNTDTNPNITEKITICLGLFETFLAVAAGIISIPVIKSSPTILIEMAIRAAVRIVKIALNLSGFIPSASDNS